jgi:hypothetical protein
MTQNKPTIDYYSSATSTSAMATTTLEDLIEAIRSDEYAAKITRLRSTLAAGDDDAYAVAKKDLQAVSISGTCDGRRAKAIEEGRFVHSGFLQLDFDAADNVGWTVEEIVEILQAEPRIVAAFVSPSGAGVKGIARIPVCTTKDQHVAAFVAARNHFRAHNLTMDEACKDPVRLMFVSHDPAHGSTSTAPAMFEPVAPSEPRATEGNEEVINEAQGSQDTHSQNRLARASTPGSWRHRWWCRFAGMTEADAVCQAPAYDGTLRRAYQPTEVVDAVRTVYSSACRNRVHRLARCRDRGRSQERTIDRSVVRPGRHLLRRTLEQISRPRRQERSWLTRSCPRSSPASRGTSPTITTTPRS